MKESFQDLLFSIPMHQLNCILPLPKKPLYYKSVEFSLSEEWFKEPTLLMIQKKEEFLKLNDINIVNQLIQDPNLIGIVLCIGEHHLIQVVTFSGLPSLLQVQLFPSRYHSVRSPLSFGHDFA